MAYFGSCHLRPLQTDIFQNSPLSPIRPKAASASGGFRLPGGTQAITVPFLRQAPALLQVQDATPRPIPLFAPTIHMLFRPEQKHGLSIKDNVLVPIAGGNSYVD
jgi:hypothetical protein